MSNKYFWNGHDINEMTQVDDDLDNDKYINFPGDTTDISYAQYDDNVSNYLINNGCIFNTNFSGKKIRAKKEIYTNENITVNIQDKYSWCNRVKIVVKSASGVHVGPHKQDPIAGQHKNETYGPFHKNTHNHEGTGNLVVHRRHHQDNRNYNWAFNWDNRNKNNNHHRIRTITTAHNNENTNVNTLHTSYIRVDALPGWDITGNTLGGLGSMVYTNTYCECNENTEIVISIQEGVSSTCILQDSNSNNEKVEKIKITCNNGGDAVSGVHHIPAIITQHGVTHVSARDLFGRHQLVLDPERYSNSNVRIAGPVGVWATTNDQWNNRVRNDRNRDASNENRHSDDSGRISWSINYHKDQLTFLQITNPLLGHSITSNQLIVNHNNETVVDATPGNAPIIGTNGSSEVEKTIDNGITTTTNSGSTQEVIVYFFYVPE